jgi:hypothetical protein
LRVKVLSSGSRLQGMGFRLGFKIASEEFGLRV